MKKMLVALASLSVMGMTVQAMANPEIVNQIRSDKDEK